MSDVLPTGEEEHEELDAPEPDSLAAELGLDLSPEQQRETEEMVASLRARFGLDQEEEAEPEPGPSEPEAEPAEPAAEPEPEAEPAAPVAADEWITIDGRAVPVAEARSMLELRQYLATHPEKAQAVRRAVEEEPEPEPEPEPAPPEFLDLDDPSQRFMWEQFKRQNAQIGALSKTLEAQAEAAREARLTAEVMDGLQTFRGNHPELSEEDVQTVRLHAAALNIIGGISQTMPGPAAVAKALEMAYMDHPDFRAKAMGVPSPKETKAAENKARKTKLAGIAGSSASATRQPEPDKKAESDREMRSQAAQWLREQNIL
jgi:hypothetical protein